jgi:hypothetical protein
MQVPIELDDDQIESITVEGLKRSYEANLTFPDEPDYEKLHQAFHVLLPYFMGEEKFTQFAVKVKKDTDKLLEQEKKLRKFGKALSEAYRGL